MIDLITDVVGPDLRARFPSAAWEHSVLLRREIKRLQRGAWALWVNLSFPANAIDLTAFEVARRDAEAEVDWLRVLLPEPTAADPPKASNSGFDPTDWKILCSLSKRSKHAHLLLEAHPVNPRAASRRLPALERKGVVSVDRTRAGKIARVTITPAGLALVKEYTPHDPSDALKKVVPR